MVVQGLLFDRDSSLWVMRCMNVELADSISKRGIFSVQQLLYLPKATLQSMIGKFPASKLYQRKVSLFRHHTGEHQFRARKWNTSTWELYALIREYLSLITWLFTWSYHQLWTRKWKAAEDKARARGVGGGDKHYTEYFAGLNFAVHTFPPIALAIIGSFYLNLKPRESIRRKGRKLTAGFSNPLVVNTLLGNLKPAKSLMLNSWQLKYLKVETRFGLLAEVCLAFLLFPILSGLGLFRLLGIQFEAFIWEWQKTGRIYLAGEICLVTGLVIWITSLPQIRRKQFEIFYYTHHLYMVFLVFFLFHAGDCHFYMVFPGIFLFGLDKLLLIIQSRPETCILSARIFLSKAIELILPKDPGPKYTPTSIIFVKVPSISKYEWHSFSITSSSRVDDNTISIMIKSEGSWTSSLSHMIQTRQESDGDQTKYIPIAVEGPYGSVSMDFLSAHDIPKKFPRQLASISVHNTACAHLASTSVINMAMRGLSNRVRTCAMTKASNYLLVPSLTFSSLSRCSALTFSSLVAQLSLSLLSSSPSGICSSKLNSIVHLQQGFVRNWFRV
ncbi:unnamed protein product [Prunus armeniaca]